MALDCSGLHANGCFNACRNYPAPKNLCRNSPALPYWPRAVMLSRKKRRKQERQEEKATRLDRRNKFKGPAATEQSRHLSRIPLLSPPSCFFTVQVRNYCPRCVCRSLSSQFQKVCRNRWHPIRCLEVLCNCFMWTCSSSVYSAEASLPNGQVGHLPHQYFWKQQPFY